MSTKYSWLFFDADNTLFDFSGSSEKAFDSLIKHYDLSDKEDAYNKYKIWNHQVWDEFEKGLIDSTELRTKRFQLFFDEIEVSFDPLEANDKYLNYLVDHASLLPGALDLLNELQKRDINMIIITNGLKEVQKPRIEKVGLNKYFQSIIVSDEIGVAKPNPKFFEVAARSVNDPKIEDVLVIGDSLKSDIKGGINYGYATCWFNPSKKPNELGIVPTYEITQLKEILNLV